PVNITPLPAGMTESPTNVPSSGSLENAPKIDSGDVTGRPQTDPNLRKDWPRDREIFKSDTVHFDFDSSVLKAGEKSNVAALADHIQANPMYAVEIEGHCDDGGTEEYNRALGERRALALREELVKLGIDPGRVDTLTFGEDKPVAKGHDEAAYRQNRRGEFV